MNKLFIYFVLLNTIFASLNGGPISKSVCPGGDWVPFGDEKCFKFVKKFKTRYEAEEDCNRLALSDDTSIPTLAHIKCLDEQDHLIKYLNETLENGDGVWIGAKRRTDGSNVFEWTDGSRVEYNNWDIQCPTPASEGRDCVDIKAVSSTEKFTNLSDVEASMTKIRWRDVRCNKHNNYVCEKMQAWSFAHQQKMIMHIKHHSQKLASSLRHTQRELYVIRNKLATAVPPGTIAYFAMNKAPDGWLMANGQHVSRVTYVDLFESIGTNFGSGDGCTTFQVPDLRGEFIRGWSKERDVDKGRTFGSFQCGSIIPMASHIDGKWTRIGSTPGIDHWNTYGNGTTFDEGFKSNILPNHQICGTYLCPRWTHYIETKTDGQITSWNVLSGTRPRNIALLACIKY